MPGLPVSLKDAVGRHKSKALFFAKLSISLGLVVYLVWIVDWERALKIAGDADKSILATVSFVLLARLVAASFRWKLVLADSNVVFPFWQAYTGYLVGAFYDILLPGVTGGDAIRIGRCVRQTSCRIGTATAGVLLERLSGIFALLCLALFAPMVFPAVLFPALDVPDMPWVRVLATAGITILAVALLGRRVWLRWLPQEGSRGIWSFIRAGMQTLCTLRGRTLGIVLILSAMFQAADIVATFLLSQALGFSVPLIVFFAVIPLVYVAICMPISLGGLGIREGMFVFLLSKSGVAASDAVMLSFLVYVNRVVIASLGGFVQLVQALYHEQADRKTEYANVVGVQSQDGGQLYVQDTF